MNKEDWEWDTIEGAFWCSKHFEYFSEGNACPDCWEETYE